MKRIRLWVKLALLLCAAMTVFSATPTSLAYIISQSTALHNAFRTEYLPPQDISVPVAIHKSMVCPGAEAIGPGGFDFCLENAQTGETAVATTSDEGLATMHLTFTAEDLGKTYHYRLYELNTGRKHVIYDDTVYDISVALVLNEIHEMSAQLTVNGQPVTQITAQYTNQYSVSRLLPDTGDHTHLLLWLAMLLVSGAGLAMLSRNRSIFRRIQ